MGLFSRNESAAGSGRRSASSESQASDLRGRARRRLIGALALVLAAVIIVPMLFDSSVPPDQVSTPVVVPAIVPPPAPDANIAQAPAEPDATAPGGVAPAPEAGADAAAPDPAADAPLPPDTGAPPPAPEPEPVAEPKPKAAEKPAAKHEPKPAADRTDDGSVAIALLEGRSPGKKAPAPAAKGNFILQIAAYTNDKDAQTRRDRLVSSGVTNAYVENAVSGGKTTYRLRVGPFPTRDAAQAAQARLRALGYDNGFISTK
ncbi:SPOR domain-containing protein [Pollutimonas bauzanensis]|uniref:DedD protein n=1 Tax=Pollutimonas bauzanensis TaxID=658167 RepID=A0A1M5WKV8_9BURK|nr:SPOR domain-containing protein [Pollutimonas bauzanensis]SHH88230.1 DedD protein [Pollutimonas bauzanensis]